MATRKTDLPGVGTKHTLDLELDGQLVAVHHRVGHWELARVDEEGNTNPLLKMSESEGAELGRILTQAAPEEDDPRREMLFRTIGLEWVTLDEDSRLRGRTLSESAIRVQTGASVIAVLRGDESIPNPGPEFRFEADDTLVVIGHREQVEQFLAVFVPATRST